MDQYGDDDASLRDFFWLYLARKNLEERIESASLDDRPIYEAAMKYFSKEFESRIRFYVDRYPQVMDAFVRALGNADLCRADAACFLSEYRNLSYPKPPRATSTHRRLLTLARRYGVRRSLMSWR